MLTHIHRDIGLHAQDAPQTEIVSALPWTAGQLSLFIGASPAVANGDVMAFPYGTSPDNLALALTSTGVPSYVSNGNTAGQTFLFDVYDWSLRAWYGAITVHVNDQPPVMLDTQPHIIALARNVAIDIDMTSYCFDPESGQLVVTSTDAMPSGLVLDTVSTSATFNHLIGTPDTAGSYPAHFSVMDPAGNILNYPLFTFNVGTEASSVIYQTITIFKSKAGTQGPSGGGTDGITLNLTKGSYSVLCYAEGTPIDPTFAGVDGYATVFKGAADDTAAATLTATGTGCTGTVNSATDTPVVGQPKGYYRVTGLTADNATLNITAVDSGATITRQFVITRALAGYQIVSALPTSNLFDGRMVYLTTDGKLYRYKAGLGWTAATAAADITGQITSTQITDGSISTPKLAAGSVATANLIAGAVTTNSLAAGAITAAKVAASSVITATAQIGDLIVSTIKIQNDAVTDAASVYANTSSFIDVKADAVGSGWHDLPGCTLSYTSVGGRVMIDAVVEMPCLAPANAGFYPGDGINFRIIRDSTVISTVNRFDVAYFTGSWSGIFGTWHPLLTDTPTAGSHTYKIQYQCFVQGNGFATAVSVYGRGMVINEQKK